MLLVLTELPVPLQALVGGLFCWVLTTVGAGFVLLNKKIPARLMDAMLGFAGGVMLSASFFSLLLPAIKISESIYHVIGGFMLGGITMRVLDLLIPHIHPISGNYEGRKSEFRKITLFTLAVTIHNIPEGFAVGIGFAENFASGAMLSIGIGIQNVPEGLAIALPLLILGYSNFRAFIYGSLSGFVEPVFAFLGALAFSMLSNSLVYAFSFASGAMIFVIIEDIIPEAETRGNSDIATMSALVGFTIMMFLDNVF